MKLLVPVVVGVPEMMPVDGASDSPAGRLPEIIDQAYGVAPPLAKTVAEYALFLCPDGREVVVILTPPPTTAVGREVLVFEPAEFDAVTATRSVEPYVSGHDGVAAGDGA